MENDLSSLSEEQLNWKPSPAGWSVAQCLKHLLLASEGYILEIDQLLKNTTGQVHRESRYSPTWMGRIMIWLVAPSSRLRIPAPPSFQPQQAEIYTPEIVKQYHDMLKKIAEQIEASSSLEWNRCIVRSPLSSFIRINLGDAFELLTFHSLRHLKQAQRVIGHPQFPHK